jgi:hypothetical protein
MCFTINGVRHLLKSVAKKAPWHRQLFALPKQCALPDAPLQVTQLMVAEPMVEALGEIRVTRYIVARRKAKPGVRSDDDGTICQLLRKHWVT